MSEEYQIKDLSSLHKYRTELPNIIFELGLTADHIGVYSLLKRIAGDNGSCFSSNTKLGEKLKMTSKTFAKFKDDLTKPFELLGGLSLIELQERNTPEKGRQSDLVTINDIWPVNMAFMAKMYKTPPPTSNLPTPLVKFTYPPTSNLPTPLVKFTDEEETIKKNPIKEEQQQQGAAVVGEKKSFSSETINYKTPSGKTKSIESSEIYAHFLKSNFKTEVIAEAIQIVKLKQEPIGNILKFLESVCFSIAEKPASSVKSSKPKTYGYQEVPKCTAKGVRPTDEQLAKIGMKRKD
jgi:hypothetical protein